MNDNDSVYCSFTADEKIINELRLNGSSKKMAKKCFNLPI